MSVQGEASEDRSQKRLLVCEVSAVRSGSEDPQDGRKRTAGKLYVYAHVCINSSDTLMTIAT